MELLAEIHERDVFPQSNAKAGSYKLRRVANAVVQNDKDEIALMYLRNDGYHLLPGGKIEKDEDIESTLKREVLEETGYDIDIGDEVGAVILYEEKLQTINISYTFLARAIAFKRSPVLTEPEKKAGFLQWMSLDGALDAVQKDKPEDLLGPFLVARERVVLQKAKELLSKS